MHSKTLRLIWNIPKTLKIRSTFYSFLQSSIQPMDISVQIKRKMRNFIKVTFTQLVWA